MATIKVSKASPVGDQKIPDVCIQIEGGVPDLGDLDKWAEYYERDAEKLFEALKVLPGGTWDRLYVKMARKHLSLLCISLFPPERG